MNASPKRQAAIDQFWADVKELLVNWKGQDCSLGVQVHEPAVANDQAI